MRISLETEYAIRCFAYIKHHALGVSTLADISAGTHAPQAFLSKVL